MTGGTSDALTAVTQPPRQRLLFGPDLPFEMQVGGPETACEIVPIEKRRDGGTRYWCCTHRSDATAKGGVPEVRCRTAHVVPIRPDEIQTLDLDKYLGG